MLQIAKAKESSLAAVVQELERLTSQPDSPVRAIQRQAATEGTFSDIPAAVEPRLREALERRGIQRLYTHQAEALEQIEGGKNTVIVTPTASGKTLCYNLPVLNLLLREPEARAIYLFPTKALAEDQLHGCLLYTSDAADE